ncbi:MAG: hypothetical protein HDR31_02315 [Mycoplasma sp.]|nr:hypothetical protein [Mycoplasma sp.]
MVKETKTNNFRIIDYSLNEENDEIIPYFYKFEHKNSIAFLATLDYFKFLSVTIQSYITYHKEKTEFIIITNEKNDLEFKKLPVNNDNLFYTFIVVNSKIDLDKFSEWGWNKKWSPFIFCKLILTNKIFKSFKKILFVDCDCIFLGNISELFLIDMGKNQIAGANDFPCISLNYLRNTFNDIKTYNYDLRKKILNEFDCEINYYTYINRLLKVNSYEYINCGVVLFNLENIEDFSNSKLWIKDLMVLEQDMLNVVFKNKKMIISPIYNYPFVNKKHLEIKIDSLISQSHEKDWIEAFKNKKIVHFYMSQKPWISIKMKKSETHSFWFNFAKKTNYWSQILKVIKAKDKQRRHQFYLRFISLKWIPSMLKKMVLSN